MVYMQVGETLFKIHKFFFERDSSHFRGLTNPASPGRTPIGTSDSEAYKLDNVNADEFARFLWIFYNPYVAIVSPSSGLIYT